MFRPRNRGRATSTSMPHDQPRADVDQHYGQRYPVGIHENDGLFCSRLAGFRRRDRINESRSKGIDAKSKPRVHADELVAIIHMPSSEMERNITADLDSLRPKIVLLLGRSQLRRRIRRAGTSPRNYIPSAAVSPSCRAATSASLRSKNTCSVAFSVRSRAIR